MKNQLLFITMLMISSLTIFTSCKKEDVQSSESATTIESDTTTFVVNVFVKEISDFTYSNLNSEITIEIYDLEISGITPIEILTTPVTSNQGVNFSARIDNTREYTIVLRNSSTGDLTGHYVKFYISKSSVGYTAKVSEGTSILNPSDINLSLEGIIAAETFGLEESYTLSDNTVHVRIII